MATPKITQIATVGGTIVGTPIIDAAGTIDGVSEGVPSVGDEVFQIASGTSTVTELGYLSSYQTDGGGFAGGLVADSAGNLYGTTIYGGGGDGSANGVLFEIDAATHTLTPLASSTTNSPASAPVIDSKGDLFFVDGGSEIDELAAGSSTFTTLATIDARGPLTIDAAGNIYGQNGAGAYGYGSVFEVSSQTGAVKTLIDFNGANGEESSGGLVLDAAGNLYGNAHNLFEIPAGTQTETILADFADGGLSETNQIALDAAGDIIGTTTPSQGSPDGSVYELAAGSSVVTTLIADAQGVGGLTTSPQGELYGASSDAVYEIALCYCPGTLILTPVGEVAAETLTIGDTVVTASGQYEPIRWIGHRSYAGAFVAGRHLMLPVCFKRGALADGAPHTDLWVSPGHAMLVDGQLVPAWRLINGVSVVQAEAVEEVTYIHIELDRHDILLANGAEAESFLDDDCRGQFHNAAEFQGLYPDAVPMVPFAPRLEDGFGLQRLQERIAARAGVFRSPEPIGPLRGFVDLAGADRVSGWAQDEHSLEEPVTLEVSIGGLPAFCILANAYRADLRKAGMGSGCHAFDMQLPEGTTGPVSVRRATDGSVLTLTHAATSKLLVGSIAHQDATSKAV